MNHERNTVEAKDIPSERRPHLRIAVTPECNFIADQGEKDTVEIQQVYYQ